MVKIPAHETDKKIMQFKIKGESVPFSKAMEKKRKTKRK
jgi:hypothetical protein